METSGGGTFDSAQGAGLIPRFCDVESGSVEIDGINARHLRQEDPRRSIGFVPQKAVLFSDTIANNIRYGNEDASDDEVRPRGHRRAAG